MTVSAISRSRRRLPRRFPPIPTVKTDDSRTPNTGSAERAALTAQEKRIALINEIADFVSARIVSAAQLGNALKVWLYPETITHFAGRLDALSVRRLVDAAILQEGRRRAEIARERLAVDAKKPISPAMQSIVKST